MLAKIANGKVRDMTAAEYRQAMNDWTAKVKSVDPALPVYRTRRQIDVYASDQDPAEKAFHDQNFRNLVDRYMDMNASQFTKEERDKMVGFASIAWGWGVLSGQQWQNPLLKMGHTYQASQERTVIPR